MLKIHSGKVGKVVVRVPSYPNECYDSVKRLMDYLYHLFRANLTNITETSNSNS